MLLSIHPQNPETRKIKQVVDCLQSGGVIIYPTDTVYAFGCDINQSRAFERICQLKKIKPEKANFSILFNDLAHISDFTKPFSNTVFKLLKKHLPGPYTFILEANTNIPKIFRHSKKTIGIRIPNNIICKDIVTLLDQPLITSSLHDDDEIIEFTTDPEEIYKKYEKHVDIVIDGGFGNNTPSTVVSCIDGNIEVIREGAGEIDF
ncbi:MAG: threonylcarbamoyl-AMP synthase [Bacteroidetes bacterium]|nr:threonylcarbamoyl-AMP synthase [Bacteroidota bacterium]